MTSNYLTVAAVTATIARQVSEALAQIPAPSKSPVIRYGLSERDPAFVGCTIVLYRLNASPFRRNDAVPARNHEGAFVQKPRVAVEADYLFAFSGDEATLEPHRFLGAVVSAFNAQPFLSFAAMRHTIQDTPYLSGLAGADQAEHIRLRQRDVDDETLSRVWGLFPGIPYQLSAFYTASPLTIEAEVTPVAIPPVSEVQLSIEWNRPRVPGLDPTIEIERT